MKKKEIVFFALIILLGIFFRFYLIKEMPGGLFPDEAANGLDINNIFKGHWLPFFARGNGREALFFYLEAISVYFFGRGFWQHHIVSAAIGVLAIATTYLMTSRLYGKSTALLASFLMATGTWAIVLSRTAFRATMIPLFLTTTVYFITRTLQAQTKKEKIWCAIFSGIFFGAGFYTYIAYRILPIVLLVMLAVLLIADRKQGFIWVKENLQAFWVSAVSTFVTLIPLGYYFFTHPGSFLGRSGQVSIFNPDLNHGHLLATIVQVFKATILGFFTQGDLNWRQNISGLPFLSRLISPFFGVALIVVTLLSIRFIWQVFRGTQNNAHIKHLLMTGIFWGMLIPEVTTNEGIPHGLRLIGTLSATYILTAVGMVWFARWVMSIWHPKWIEKLYVVVVAMFFAVLVTISYIQYFSIAYNNSDNYFAFRSDLSYVSDYLNSHPDKAHNYLVLDLFSLQTVDYFTTTTGNSYIVVDPANSTKIHLQEGDRLTFTQSTYPDFIRYINVHRNIEIVREGSKTDRLLDPVMNTVVLTSNDGSKSFSATKDLDFNIINFGDRIDFEWPNLSFDPWSIKIWQCADAKCTSSTLIKDNQQNDYLSTHDNITADGTKADMYFHAIAYDGKGGILRDFGILKLDKYK